MATATQPPPSTNGAKTNVPATVSMVDKEVSYKPFLAESEIRLSPRIIIDFLVKPTKSGQKCTVDQAIRFMMLCKARGLNPWEGDAFCIGFDGKPVGSGKNRPTFTTIDEAGRWFDGLTPIDLPKTERNSPP